MNEYEFTIEEIDTLREAVKEWITASKTSSRLVGLLLGGMLAAEGDTDSGEKALQTMVEGEDEKEQVRTEQAAILQAKLVQIRRKLMAEDAGKFMATGEK